METTLVRNRPAALDRLEQDMLIDGKRVPALSGQRFETRNPATGELLALVAQGGAQDVDRAVAAARAAFEGPWRRMRPAERQRIMLRLADLVEEHYEELALLDTLDLGAPLARTVLGKTRAGSLLRYYAGQATLLSGDTLSNSAPGDVLSHTLKEPIGVVAAINPWNGPIGMSVWKAGPVLASGCTMVMKPAEQTPLSALRFGELCLEAGVPNGVINILTGLGDAGAALSSHPGIDKIAFTGSTGVGEKILHAAASTMKRVSVELGGKSPNIVFADANLDKAVPAAAMAVFANSGQICSAGTRLFVQREIHDEFMARLAEFTRTIRVGDPLDPATQIGPVVSAPQMDKILGFIESAGQEGAQALVGGARMAGGGLDGGYFIEPTIFTGVTDDMTIAREEIFGPVLSAFAFDTVEEVLGRANATPFGLGSGVWTRDLSTAHRMARGIQAGSVWINCYQMLDPGVPFGGYKLSGFGRESGPHHIEEYLETKAVWINLD
ncbi:MULTISPECIES: aldehyde dehydrogenase family protein [unclassified Novosphingobium]|uniref:aldehyde dehydrogenase family protein n=1 Tax=unclassified Novosphingobium TaxID=2644732 RepID=UPI000869442D|nr:MULTISPECIES: aldehyde dehydrogenase family protein [unclassified Novosphingobium]MBN9145545.1 aldehyde dehydrogenase family protein [Novosphingobium sp.]ODU80827.1 MAG: betaine-aldehyde dehydrogenase [Novosphingobium sp. SCN 63-17]OJX87977.1 MAG: betaine-aldehyde dehydrogenase [Novosphingobium sp. 63-713]